MITISKRETGCPLQLRVMGEKPGAMNSTFNKRRTSAACNLRKSLRDVFDAAAALHQTVQVCVVRYVDVVAARELRAKFDRIVGKANIAGNV